MGSDPQYANYPDLELAQHIFQLSNPSAPRVAQEASLLALQNAIKEHSMAPLYRYLAHPVDGILNASGEGTSSKPAATGAAAKKPSPAILKGSKAASQRVEFPWDEKLYEELSKKNEAELEGYEKEMQEAEEKAGDQEVLKAKGKKAELWARVGDKEKAIASYETVYEKTGPLGAKIDLVLAIIRMAMFFNDRFLVKKNIERAKELVETGGDWDRRNRLKAYQGLHLVSTRYYDLAAPLLLDSLSTFTSYELCSYSQLVLYAVLAGSVSLKRVDFKAKVVDAPEIKAILGNTEDKASALSGALASGPGAGDEEMSDADTAAANGDLTSATPNPTAVNINILASGAGVPDVEASIDFSPLASLVTSLYFGRYQSFFSALAQTEEKFLSQDRLLWEHRGWYVREMRLRAYSQLLQSYRVVSMTSMAHDFGVSIDFLDRDLAKFIAAGKIPCTIDRVNGVIETNRPDDKNKQYNDVVKQGDQLITKLQKYGQAVRLRGSERA